MDCSVKELIQKRRSVRTFDGAPLRASDRAAMERFLKDVPNPFGVSVEFRLLDAKEHRLSSPVILGTDSYIAAKVARGRYYEIGFGYSFESACLYAESLGLGTVMLAASLSRAAFEKAMELQADEVLLTASPVGYPAGKRSLRESLMRKALKADERRAFEDLFFTDSFEKTLPRKGAGVFASALEMARWAPSAANQQPWRAVLIGDTLHFYEKKSMKDSPLGDIQKVDLGIFLAHFDLTMQEEGHKGQFLDAKPGLSLPESLQYILSYTLTE